MTSPDPAPTGSQITCVASEDFQAWLAGAGGSLVVSTYQAGKVAFAGWAGRQVSLMLRHFERPMGLAVQVEGAPASPQQLAIITRQHLFVYANAPELAAEYPLPPAPPAARRYAALFLPRLAYYTGDLNLHDVAFTDDGLLAVNTRFSCLVRPSGRFAFEPVWQPPFLTELAPEDRCHLNGLAVRAGRPAFVTALGETDSAGGWRPGKSTGGVVINVASGEVVCRGLCMPHSPRWHDGGLWLLNSGTGELCCLDLKRGQVEVVCSLPGYLRGLCFVAGYALVGLCKIRERHTFGGLPVQQRHPALRCGVAVVELASGRMVGMLEFASGCEELYDVQWLPGVHRATILGPQDPVAAQALPAPGFGCWMLPGKDVAGPITPSQG
ncbi:MAG: TIGR03032 family protein [Gemmataceae bacterium]|nr:TIGR03032 family protein [Gemmataceae bacterium]